MPDLLCFLEFQAYNGDDYNGARIVSRASELRDAVRLLVLLLQIFFSLLWGLLFFLFIILISFLSGTWDAVTDGPCTGCLL